MEEAVSFPPCQNDNLSFTWQQNVTQGEGTHCLCPGVYQDSKHLVLETIKLCHYILKYELCSVAIYFIDRLYNTLKAGHGDHIHQKAFWKGESMLNMKHVKTWLVSFQVFFFKDTEPLWERASLFSKFRKESVTCWALPCSRHSHAACSSWATIPCLAGNPCPTSEC